MTGVLLLTAMALLVLAGDMCRAPEPSKRPLQFWPIDCPPTENQLSDYIDGMVEQLCREQGIPRHLFHFQEPPRVMTAEEESHARLPRWK